MSYISAFLLPITPGNLDAYVEIEKTFGGIAMQNGAKSYIVAKAEDVPHGEQTDFYRSVNAQQGETVLVAFAVWPDKASSEKGMAAAMEDPAFSHLNPQDMPFDSKRMIWGGFTPIVEF